MKKTALISLLIAVSLLFSSCKKDDGSGYIFKQDIESNPVTLDPQSSNDKSASIIIENVFQGLLVQKCDGTIANGVAESYTVSDDGLIYSFKLRDSCYWTDKSQKEYGAICTANDFVYGFQRLFNPETQAPLASEFFCIKNSKLVNMGQLHDITLIGVKAVSDFELEITLDYPNPQLPLLLTTPAAMPCNEEFFLQSQGKYGLSAETTPSNGSFYVKQWNYDQWTDDNNNLVLRRHPKNSEYDTVMPYGLNFFIEKKENFYTDFTAEQINSISVSGKQAQELIKDEYPYAEYKDIVWGLTFNFKNKLFKDDNFRKALAASVNRKQIKKLLSEYSIANAIVPPQVTILDVNYREFAGDNLAQVFDTDAANDYFTKAEIDYDIFTGIKLLLPDNDEMINAVSYILQEWQKDFGFYCVVEILSESELEKRVVNSDYEFALVKLTGSYNSPAAYLEAFERSSADNHGRYADTAFEKLMSSAKITKTLTESSELYKQAEQFIIDDAAFIPLFYQTEYFITDKDSLNLAYNPFTKTVNYTKAINVD